MIPSRSLPRNREQNARMQVAGHFIPDSELVWSFGPSGGPGGQHANRSHTRAELRFDLADSPSLPEDLKSHMLARLGNRAQSGQVVVVADTTRSQLRNREIARERLTQILSDAADRPRRRRATRPTVSSRERRLQEKRKRSETKRSRRPDYD